MKRYIKKPLYLFFILLTLSYGLPGFSRPPDSKGKEEIKLYNLGVEFASKAQYDEAINHFNQAIIKCPNFPQAYLMKGRALYLLGKYDEALKVFETVLAMDVKKNGSRKNSRALCGKAVSLYLLKQYTKSIESSNLALSYDETHAPSYEIRANAYGALGNYRLAVEDYNKAIELDPNNDLTYLNRFCPLYQLRRYQEALESCDLALKVTTDPTKLPQVYSKKAAALVKLERYEEALENAEKALKINPQDPLALSEKKLALAKLKREEI